LRTWAKEAEVVCYLEFVLYPKCQKIFITNAFSKLNSNDYQEFANKNNLEGTF
ncbi:2609_t:CDS:1, partial [Gigaspora margarita]